MTTIFARRHAVGSSTTEETGAASGTAAPVPPYATSAVLRFFDEFGPDDVARSRREDCGLAVVEPYDEWNPAEEEASWVEDDRRQELRDDV